MAQNHTNLNTLTGRIVYFLSLLMIFTLYACTSNTDNTDDRLVCPFKPGNYTAQLAVCEIKNPAISRFIDTELHSYIKEHQKLFYGSYFYVEEWEEGPYGMVTWFSSYNFKDSPEIESGSAWLTRGGYQFVIDPTALKYFTILKDEKHEFKYTVTETFIFTDPIQFGLKIKGDSYKWVL